MAHITDILPAALPANTPEAASDAARAAQLAARVDMPAITAAAAMLAQAMQAFADRSGEYGTDSTGTCLDSGCMVELGNTGSDTFDVPRVLIIDLGGSDTYKGAMATSAPGIPIALPISAILDLGGNDLYTSSAVAPGQTDMNWAQGVGVGGIGLVLDVGGDDTYDARLQNKVTPSSCPPDYSTFHTARQFVMAQGVGVLGVGAVLDVLGNDRYTALNTYYGNVPCHWGKVYTWAQGVGMHFGVGGLFNVDGNDAYYAYSEAAYVDDNLAITTAQGAGAGGVGVLADALGSDSYVASSYAHLGSVIYRNKGGFAWTFAQGSVLTTGFDPANGQFQPLNVAAPIGAAPRAVNLCASLAQAPFCDSAGAGILVEGAGSDRYTATATATEPQGCGWTATGVVSAQGSAAWSGLAALLNLDVQSKDSFSIASTGTGGGCFVLGARAHTYGQGYGGSIHWLFWEFTAPDSIALAAPGMAPVGSAAPFWAPAVGVLVNAADLNAPGAALTLGNLLGGPGDSYYATSYGNNFYSAGCQWGQCPYGIAETWVQGAAGNLADTAPLTTTYSYAFGDTRIFGPTGPVTAGTGVGVGVHVDALGDDTYFAQSYGTSTAGPGYAQVRTVAQGAAVKGIALLANLGGRDAYGSYAYKNGVNTPGLTQAQGYAEGMFTGVVSCPGPCTPSQVAAFPAVGIQVDIAGSDTYTEASEPFSGGCQVNDAMWGTVLPGCLPTSPAYTSRGIGLDQLSSL